MQTALLLTDGFEDAEAVIIRDILARLDVPVTMVSCSCKKNVTSYFGMTLLSDELLRDVSERLYDAVIIPGGPQATRMLAASQDVLSFIAAHDTAGKWICAICSASARVLAANNMLKGRRYTCSGELWRDARDGIYDPQKVVVDGNLITGRGLGVTFDFAFTVADRLSGHSEAVREQAAHIYYDLL